MSSYRQYDRPPNLAVRLLSRIMGQARGLDAAWDLSVWPFLVAGVAALIFAVVTVGGHAMRAAMLNPVTAIKRE